MRLNIIEKQDSMQNKTWWESVFKLFLTFLTEEKKKLSLHSEVINLVITSDEELRLFNKNWRGIDKTTDVLSFPYIEKIGEQSEVFGDILLSLPQCKKQALFLAHPLKNELAILFVHSLLHLWAYDHIEDEDFFLMQQFEQKIKKRLKEEKIIE
jgi:probable rRNA maturation factor